MAALRSRLCVTGIALTASTAETVAQIVSASNQRVRILEVGVFFDGTTSTDPSVLCELIVQTSAGTMSSGTLRKLENSLSETIQTTARHTATGEPTDSGDIKAYFRVHPQGGTKNVDAYNVVMAGGTRLGLRLTASANVNVTIVITIEE